MNGSLARFRMKTVLAYLGKSLWAVYLLNAVINNSKQYSGSLRNTVKNTLIIKVL